MSSFFILCASKSLGSSFLNAFLIMQDFTVVIQTACRGYPALAMFSMYVLESALEKLWKMVSENSSSALK